MRQAGDVCFSEVFRDRDGELFAVLFSWFNFLFHIRSPS